VRLVRDEEGNGLLGAKITGGGAGGTVAVLGYARPEAEAAFNRVAERYCEKSGLLPYVFSGSSPGADDFGIAKIRLS
jgi:L-arabinokinase